MIETKNCKCEIWSKAKKKITGNLNNNLMQKDRSECGDVGVQYAKTAYDVI